MSLANVKRGNAPEIFNVIIEIPNNVGGTKYEVNKETQCLTVDRFLRTAFQYPANYGYIPETLCDDGDALDVLVITPESLVPGCVIEARPVGLLRMTDEAGHDAKLLAVPSENVCPFFSDIQDVEDVPKAVLEKVEHFFNHYKDLDEGKWVELNDFGKKAEAVAEIEQAIKNYDNQS